MEWQREFGGWKLQSTPIKPKNKEEIREMITNVFSDYRSYTMAIVNKHGSWYCRMNNRDGSYKIGKSGFPTDLDAKQWCEDQLK